MFASSAGQEDAQLKAQVGRLLISSILHAEEHADRTRLGVAGLDQRAHQRGGMIFCTLHTTVLYILSYRF